MGCPRTRLAGYVTHARLDSDRGGDRARGLSRAPSDDARQQRWQRSGSAGRPVVAGPPGAAGSLAGLLRLRGLRFAPRDHAVSTRVLRVIEREVGALDERRAIAAVVGER